MIGAAIFVSYRRDDSGGYALYLHDLLSREFGSDQIFIDVEDIPLGRRFPGELRLAVEGASAMLVVIGPRWLDALDGAGQRRLSDPHDFVRSEVTQALATGKPVIPVLVGRASLPDPVALPEDLSELITWQAIEMTDIRWKYDMSRLVDALRDRGVVPRSLIPFGGSILEGMSTRVQLADAWLVASGVPAVHHAISQFSQQHGMSVVRRDGTVLYLEGGSKGKTRLLGVWFAKPQVLPTRAMIGVSEEGSRVRIDVSINEDLGFGILDSASRERYRKYFESWVIDLREATGAPREPALPPTGTSG